MLKKVTLLLFVLMGWNIAQGASYGMAGCGIGALVFGDQPGKIQIVAATLNNLISPQTSAITSGTSNCHEDSGAVASELYIENNKVALQEDIAKGQGETLAGLLTLWNCQQTDKIQNSLQKNYSNIYSGDMTSKNIKNSIQNTIKSNVANSCGTLI